VIRVSPKIVKLAKEALEKFPDKVTPKWLSLSGEAEGKVVALPTRDEVDAAIAENLIVEYYSR